MKSNMGTIDRVLRVVLGVGLVGWGYATANWWGAIGIVPLLTAATAWCPAYLPLGISTKSE